MAHSSWTGAPTNCREVPSSQCDCPAAYLLPLMVKDILVVLSLQGHRPGGFISSLGDLDWGFLITNGISSFLYCDGCECCLWPFSLVSVSNSDCS